MSEEIVLLPIDSVKPNPWNPNYITESERRRLKEGMSSSGVSLTPPIFVRRRDDHYEIIDGEQRWLVARELGWTHIPAIIRDVSDAEAKTLTLSLNYLKGRINYAKIARWIRDRKDLEMVKAFERTFGPVLTRILEGLVNLPDDCLSRIEDAIQQNVELTLSDLEPVVKAANPYETLETVIEGKKYMRDVAFSVASHGLTPLMKSLEEEAKQDEEWRIKKIEAARKAEEEMRRKLEEEEERKRAARAKRRAEEEAVVEKTAEGVIEAATLKPTTTIEEAPKPITIIEETEEAGLEEKAAASRKTTLPPEFAKHLLEMSPEEVLKEIKHIEPLAEAAAHYQCDCGAVHALVYSKGHLEAYMVRRGGGGEQLYERLLKEASKWIYECPKCGLKFKVDFEDGSATPILEGSSDESEGGKEGNPHPTLQV